MNRYICRCRHCGKAGRSVSRTTRQRHSDYTKSRSAVRPPFSSSTSSTPPVLADGRSTRNHYHPGPHTSPNPTGSSQIPQINQSSHIRHLISQKRANFEFPLSLVFITPPTKDSTHYQLKVVDNQLLSPNSHYPLSLHDDDSGAVVGFEYLLVDYLSVLNALPLQDGDTSVSEVTTTRDEILDTMRYLDRKKGDEWNKQLCAQLNPNSFIISGEDSHVHWLE